MKERLYRLIEEVLDGIKLEELENPGVGCHDLWDSLGHFNVLMAVEEDFGVRFTTEQITEIKELAQLEACLKACLEKKYKNGPAPNHL